jgi:hypothetical protein
MIENKFSNAGYHKSKRINIGETGFDKLRLSLHKLIKFKPVTKANKKLPESTK